MSLSLILIVLSGLLSPPEQGSNEDKLVFDIAGKFTFHYSRCLSTSVDTHGEGKFSTELYANYLIMTNEQVKECKSIELPRFIVVSNFSRFGLDVEKASYFESVDFKTIKVSIADELHFTDNISLMFEFFKTSDLIIYVEILYMSNDPVKRKEYACEWVKTIKKLNINKENESISVLNFCKL